MTEEEEEKECREQVTELYELVRKWGIKKDIPESHTFGLISLVLLEYMFLIDMSLECSKEIFGRMLETYNLRMFSKSQMEGEKK